MSVSSTSSRAATWRNALGVLWIAALYFLCRPYRGVRHDAVLYFGQTQLHLTPDWLRGDLFFLSNSQDNYSAFSTLFAPVLQALGLSMAEIATMLVLHALMLLAMWRLTIGMGIVTRWAALALALVLPHFYGADHRFAFSEPFLTARTLAEPLAVFALAFLLNGRRVAAGVMAFLAAISHPLIALPALLVGWRVLCAEDRRWNWAALAILPVIPLAWMGIGPFAALAHAYDPAWLEIVHRADEFVFVGTWHIADWQQIVLDLGLLWLCARDASSPLSRLAMPALVVAACSIAVSAVGVDVFHNVLLTQLQLWRAAWVAHLVAMLSLAPLAARLWALGGEGRLATFVTLLAAAMTGSTARTSWIVMIVAFGAIVLAERRKVISPEFIRIGIGACILGAIALSGVELSVYLDQIKLGAESGIAAGRPNGVPGIVPAFGLTLALLGLWPLLRPGSVAFGVSVVCAAALLAFSASNWDQRTDWARYVERHQGHPHPFQGSMPPRATVYWADDLLASWGLLGRSSFFSQGQSSGALFSRETSTVTMDRMQTVSPLIIQSSVCRGLVATGLTQATEEDCKPTQVAVNDVCHLSPSHPDFIVLSSPIQTLPVATWRYEPADASAPIDYLLYDCSKIR